MHVSARALAQWLVLVGLFGAALLYGNGVITPAISVLSTVEGLRVATEALSHGSTSDHWSSAP